MRNGPFTDLVAKTFGIDPKTVTVTMRTLREAGYITTGARGVNAPHMTPRDAARASIALLTGAGPTKVLEDFNFYRGLTLGSDDDEKTPVFHGVASLCDQPEGHTIEDLLTWAFRLWETPEQIDPFTFKVMNEVMEPVFSFKLDESWRSVTFTVHHRKETFDYFYYDNDGLRRWRVLNDAFRATEDIDEKIAILEQQTTLEAGFVGGKGMRVTRQISTPEIATISKALFMEGE